MRYILFANVHNSGKYSNAPDSAKIFLDLEFIQKIKKMNGFVIENDFLSIRDLCPIQYYNSISDYDPDFDLDEYDGLNKYSSSGCNIVNTVLEVEEHYFLFEGNIKNTEVNVYTERIDIDELLNIETLIKRIINNDLGCSISSIINDATCTPTKYKDAYIILDHEYIMHLPINDSDSIKNVMSCYPDVKEFFIATVDEEGVIKVERGKL